MHDIVNLEGRGVPAVAVATEEFRTAAAAQGKALGFEPAMIFVGHPIQDRTPDEMVAIAVKTMEEIVQALSGN